VDLGSESDKIAPIREARLSDASGDHVRRLLKVLLSLALALVASSIFFSQVSMFRARSLRNRIVPGMSFNEFARELERSPWFNLMFNGDSKSCGVISRESSGAISMFIRGPGRGPGTQTALSGLSDPIVSQMGKSCGGVLVTFLFLPDLNEVEFEVKWDIDGKVTTVSEPRKGD